MAGCDLQPTTSEYLYEIHWVRCFPDRSPLLAKSPPTLLVLAMPPAYYSGRTTFVEAGFREIVPAIEARREATEVTSNRVFHEGPLRKPDHLTKPSCENRARHVLPNLRDGGQKLLKPTFSFRIAFVRYLQGEHLNELVVNVIAGPLAHSPPATLKETGSKKIPAASHWAFLAAYESSFEQRSDPSPSCLYVEPRGLGNPAHRQGLVARFLSNEYGLEYWEVAPMPRIPRHERRLNGALSWGWGRVKVA